METKKHTRILMQRDFKRLGYEFDPWQDMLDDWHLPANTEEVEVSYYAHRTD